MPEKTLPENPKLAELARRLEKEPGSRLFLDLAREYYQTGRLDQAAEICAKGLRHHPSYLSARVLLGRIYHDLGRSDEARFEMETVLAQAPDNLLARRVVAEISLDQGDLSGALERYHALLAFSPKDENAARRIEEIEARLSGIGPAQASEAGGAARPAREPEGPAAHAAAPAAPAIPDDAGMLATPTLAEIFLQQGLMDKAAQVYREILNGDPHNNEARVRLAEIEGAARPAPVTDPVQVARRRRIEALTSWLHAIRGGTHV